MGALKSVCIALALAAAAPAYADEVQRWRVYIDEASQRFGVPASWIERVMRAESAGRTTLHGRPIVSHAGAMGLMQLMPGTWAVMRRRLGLGSDPHAPRDNILAGTYYLRLMYDRFGYPGLFGAYNAGPARYAAYLAGRRNLPTETRAYLAKVVSSDAPVPTAPKPGRDGRLFFALRNDASGEASGFASQPGFFVELHGPKNK